MTKRHVHDEESSVSSHPGSVDIDGPDGVEVSLTPEAALKTGENLIEKAAEALGKEAFNADARRRDLIEPFPN